MSLKVREQFPEFETNEFTEERQLTLDETLGVIKHFNWPEEYSKSAKIVEEHAEPSIWLTNQLGDDLALSWAQDNRFAVYYSPGKLFGRSSTSIVNGLDQVVAFIKLFEGGERDLLLRNLRASEYHQKTSWILDLFKHFVSKGKTRASREIVKEEFIYEMKNFTILKKLTFSILFILMTPAIWIYSSILNNTPFNLVAFLVMQGFTTLMALPGIILAVNHRMKNGQWKIYFRKGENRFIIASSDGKEMLDKSDYSKRITTVNESNAPWSGFEYTTLLKSNGEQIHFSNLLIPTSDMNKLFGRLEEVRDNSAFQIIKDKKLKE